MSHRKRHASDRSQKLDRSQKKDQFVVQTSKSTSEPNKVIFAVATAFVALLAYLILFGSSKSSAVTRLDGGSNGEISIPLSDVSDGHAKFYEYAGRGNKPVRFFVIKSSDGVYRAAADACDVCYRSKMGYHQEGDDMVCNKCGRHFPSKDVNIITGSCNPDGIPRSVRADKLVINTADLDARTVLF